MLKSGQVFAQFKILEKLGEGGMGVVYLAEDQKLGRNIALKILSGVLVDNPERRERFKREAQTAASISHPNVTGIFDIGEAEDPETGEPLAFIVMEHVQGDPLDSFLEKNAPDLGTRIRMAQKIAAGLAAAHKLRILHRDIKPDNIIVTGDGEPKILDFGLAKPIGPPLQEDGFQTDQTVDQGGLTVEWEDKNLTQEGRIVGTVNYMSPEQAKGEALDTRSDVFSFGILLYRMVTGENPFTGTTQVSVLAKIIESDPDAASHRSVEVPAELDTIIDRCLQKDPADRFQDTQELVAALRAVRRQFESGVSESLSTSRAALHPATPRKRKRVVVPVLIGILMMGAIVFGPGMFRDGPASVADAGESHLAILGFENKTGDAELDWMTTGLPEILLTDLAQVSELSVIGRGRVEDHLKKSVKEVDQAGHQEWVEAGKGLGAARVLSGSFYRLGKERIRIDARLEDTGSGKILFAEKVDGPNPIELVDSLSTLIIAKLNVSDVGSNLNDLVTSSPEAYKYYHQGDEKLLIGLGDEARELYAKSLAIDSTFAMPYLRIGMSHVFDGRPQEGSEYLKRALEYKSNLSSRDRGLLDIYADVWVTQEFGDAYTKMAAFAEAYPEDKEALSIYGALLIGFSADTTQGFAMFEQALEIDPTYPFALSLYANDLSRFGLYDRAIELMERLKASYPESPDSYQDLGGYYSELGEFKKALESYEEFRQRFPSDPGVIPSMVNLAIRERDFKKAEKYVDQILAVRPGDPQWERIREVMLANLDTWHGRFDSAFRHYHRALQSARAMGDDQIIYTALITIATYHERFENPDSTIFYSEMALEYATPANRLGYAISVVQHAPERADEMRPKMREAVNEFKGHMPEELWGLADGIQEAFEAFAARDTAGIVLYFRKAMERPINQRGPETNREFGKYLVLTGEYAEAQEVLQEALETNSGWSYLDASYWVGRAEEGLGNRAEAEKHYREVLKHWGDADRELEALAGAREGMARLSS